jgi:hypothetical protein
MLIQDRDGVQQDLQISGPAVQGMDHYYIELSLSGILQKLPESRAFGHGVGMGGFPFLPVATAWDPTSGLAEFMKETFLSIQGMTFHLRWVRDSNIINRPHGPTSPPPCS